MANWYGSSRSNYFRVKNPTEFNAWADEMNLTVWPKDDHFAIAPDAYSDDGDWPSQRFNEDSNDYEEIDIPAQLAPLLADGEVAVLQSVGAEKLRYLTGWAIAVHSSGETERVSIDDIYKMASERWGASPTTATY